LEIGQIRKTGSLRVLVACRLASIKYDGVFEVVRVMIQFGTAGVPQSDEFPPADIAVILDKSKAAVLSPAVRGTLL